MHVAPNAKAPAQRRPPKRTLRRSPQTPRVYRAAYQIADLDGSPPLVSLRRRRQGPGLGRRALAQAERPDLVLSREDLPPSVLRGLEWRAATLRPIAPLGRAAPPRAWPGPAQVARALRRLLSRGRGWLEGAR